MDRHNEMIVAGTLATISDNVWQEWEANGHHRLCFKDPHTQNLLVTPWTSYEHIAKLSTPAGTYIGTSPYYTGHLPAVAAILSMAEHAPLVQEVSVESGG